MEIYHSQKTSLIADTIRAHKQKKR